MDLGETALVRVTESLPSLHFLLPLSDLFTLICIQLWVFFRGVGLSSIGT